MRVFIGLDLPQDIRSALAKTSADLSEDLQSGRWIKPENYHLTLKFLGEISPEQIHEISEALDEQLSICKRPRLRLSQLGSFKRGRKELIWVGFESNMVLERLAEGVEISLEKFGFKPEKRKYFPHITLAREVETGISWSGAEVIKTEFEVSEITVFESRREAGVLRYLPLKRIKLS